MTGLTDLPDELLMRVVEHLDTAALRNFATVDTRFHRLLIPTLFGGLRATNRTEDAEILEQASSKYSRHIQKLYFDLHLLGNTPGVHDHQDTSDNHERSYICEDDEKDCCLPDVAQNLLSGKLLPNVTELELECHFSFDYDVEQDDHYDYGEPGSYAVLENSEDGFDFEDKECTFHWRSALRDAIAALASNTSVRTLRVRNLVPKGTTACSNTEWQNFLTRLEKFDLDLWAGDGDDEWQASGANGYRNFIAWLPELFFDHLSSLKQLRFAAGAACPVGGSGHLYMPLPISPCAITKVQKLVLENIFLNTNLLNLLRWSNGPRHIHSLTLHNCVSIGRPSDWSQCTDRVPWSLLFSTIRNSKLPLRHLVVGYDSESPGLMEGLDVWGCEEGHEGSEQVQVARREAEKTGKKVFLYGEFDEKYGYIMGKEYLNLECFQEGSDWREWELCRDWVEENKRRFEEENA